VTADVRVAAVGDVHLGPDLAGRHRAGLARIAEQADLLLLAGDLTRHGTVEEARIVAQEYTHLGVPTVAVLGNYDYHSDAEDALTALLLDAGIVSWRARASCSNSTGRRSGWPASRASGWASPAGAAVPSANRR